LGRLLGLVVPRDLLPISASLEHLLWHARQKGKSYLPWSPHFIEWLQTCQYPEVTTGSIDLLRQVCLSQPECEERDN
jgi:hypothetical protein